MAYEVTKYEVDGLGTEKCVYDTLELARDAARGLPRYAIYVGY